ncbi:cyclodeaminase/cyclohydrolase family protein [Paenarthrobacter sp. NPDC089714]|uniref:cyclodeaminase/cyclohydrolase family protein n=1 Tax=Paenarthrobacter sp. NPDC089714 TaxID=3364377 RepID=UPI0037F9CF5F
MAASQEITTQESTVEEWTEALAQSSGSPGGGAGTGVMLAIAASLTSMVAGYTEDAGEDLQDRACSLRETALRLADEDAVASKAFGAAFRLDPGPQREEAVRRASVEAAKASAVLGDHAMDAIEDLAWLATNGNPALIADVVVAFGALRAAIAGARTNVSFDLAALAKDGTPLENVRAQHPQLWETVGRLSDAMDRIDDLTVAVDNKAAPTDTL